MAETATPHGAPARTYRNLDAWTTAMTLAESTLTATRMWRAVDQFSLGVQMRRSAISIASNIAEGYSRRSPAAARYHVAIALGSHGEYETQLELARRCGLLNDATARELFRQCSSVGRLLSGLHRAATRNVAVVDGRK